MSKLATTVIIVESSLFLSLFKKKRRRRRVTNDRPTDRWRRKRERKKTSTEKQHRRREFFLCSLSPFFTHQHFFSRAFACTRLFLVRTAGVLPPQAACIGIKIEKRREREERERERTQRRHHFYVHRYASFSIEEKKSWQTRAKGKTFIFHQQPRKNCYKD
jgi:hypothetical protein